MRQGSEEEDGGGSATDLLQLGCPKEEQGSFRVNSLCTFFFFFPHSVFLFCFVFGFRTTEAHRGGWESMLLTSVKTSATCLLWRAYLFAISVFMLTIVYQKPFNLGKLNPGLSCFMFHAVYICL